MWWATLLLSKNSKICLYFFLNYNGFLSWSIELKEYVPPTQKKSCEHEVADKSRAQVGDISLKRTPVASSGAATWHYLASLGEDFILARKGSGGFPGGLAVKNLPAIQ